MPQPDRDGGITLIEVLVRITLLGVVMAFALSGYSSWARASEQSGTARELQSLLRTTQQRAVTEGRAMCVTFANTNYTVWRHSCNPASGGEVVQGPIAVNGADVRITSPVFASSQPDTLTFFARGTATKGTVQVERLGSDSKVYTLDVEGLTGRVELQE